MTFSVSPQLRVVLLAGVLAATGLLLGTFVLARGGGESSGATRQSVVPHHGAARPGRHTVPSHARRPAVPLLKGVPLPVARALSAHKIAVVSLWTPGSESDELAYREAQSGAARAGAGFVRLNVLHDRETSLLLERLGVLEAPAVLIYTRGHASPAVRLPGFVDREAVLQAVDSLRRPHVAVPATGR